MRMAGLMVAAMCDIIYASEDAKFSNPVLRMTPAGGEILMEPWDLGPRMAKEFLWTGDGIDAKEAHRLGLVNYVLEKEAARAKAYELMHKITNKGPVAISKIIESVNAYYKKDVDGFWVEMEAFGYTTGTEDFTEGARAFVEKRKPNFKGR